MRVPDETMVDPGNEEVSLAIYRRYMVNVMKYVFGEAKSSYALALTRTVRLYYCIIIFIKIIIIIVTYYTYCHDHYH